MTLHGCGKNWGLATSGGNGHHAVLEMFSLSVVWRTFHAMPSVFIALTTPGFACFVIALGPIFMSRKRTAKSEDIAAALTAATAHERPYLIAAIENRLSSRLWSAPMTTFELVLAFEDVREQHGDRARRKGLVDQRGRIEQERFVSQLAGIAGHEDRAGQGAF